MTRVFDDDELADAAYTLFGGNPRLLHLAADCVAFENMKVDDALDQLSDPSENSAPREKESLDYLGDLGDTHDSQKKMYCLAMFSFINFSIAPRMLTYGELDPNRGP
eukprot:GHVN01052166.1.p1 GENE.GHVN01052166.1~~GHVN01052166.1.p1  ORF type:complete len:107 (+),score=8.89 GHVN01052166.1:404-724(+)